MKLLLALAVVLAFACYADAQCANGACSLAAQHPNPHAQIFSGNSGYSSCGSCGSSSVARPVAVVVQFFQSKPIRSRVFGGRCR